MSPNMIEDIWSASVSRPSAEGPSSQGGSYTGVHEPWAWVPHQEFFWSAVGVQMRVRVQDQASTTTYIHGSAHLPSSLSILPPFCSFISRHLHPSSVVLLLVAEELIPLE